MKRRGGKEWRERERERERSMRTRRGGTKDLVIYGTF
jgi:hypothetical protein